jgi:hypothetical protein
MIEELDVPLVRDELMSFWTVQPAADVPYNFDKVDEVVRLSQEAEVELLAVFNDVPPWAADETGATNTPPLPGESHTGRFRDFVRSFVERYDGDGLSDMQGLTRPIAHYEFMSAIEQYPPEQYAFWLQEFCGAVRDASPAARIVLGSLRSPALEPYDSPAGQTARYFERLLAALPTDDPGYPFFDIVGFEHYPNDYPGYAPFADGYAYLERTLADRGLSRPIWITGYGYDSELSSKAQADRIVQWAIEAKALGANRVYVDRLIDEPGSPRKLGLARRGTVNQRPQRRPAFEAMAVLLDIAHDRPHVEQRRPGVYAMMGDGDPVYAIWIENEQNPPVLVQDDWWEVRTTLGGTRIRQGTHVRATPSPQFLRKVASPFIR